MPEICGRAQAQSHHRLQFLTKGGKGLDHLAWAEAQEAALVSVRAMLEQEQGPAGNEAVRPPDATS